MEGTSVGHRSSLLSGSNLSPKQTESVRGSTANQGPSPHIHLQIQDTPWGLLTLNILGAAPQVITVACSRLLPLSTEIKVASFQQDIYYAGHVSASAMFASLTSPSVATPSLIEAPAFNLLKSSWLEVSKARGSSSKNCLNASLYSTVLLFVFTHVNNNSAETAEAHPPDLLRGTSSFMYRPKQHKLSSHHNASC